jgi:hypothetical protein
LHKLEQEAAKGPANLGAFLSIRFLSLHSLKTSRKNLNERELNARDEREQKTGFIDARKRLPRRCMRCNETRFYVMGGGGWESGEVLQAFNGIKIEFGSDLADFVG